MNAMTIQSLAELVPAAFAEKPKQNVSDNYTFLSTKTIITELEQVGWLPVHANQVKARKAENQVNVRHVIRFRENVPANDDFMPEILIVNSHNRSSTLQVHYGMYRLVCANGLVLGKKLAEPKCFRHQHYQIGDILEAVDTVRRQASQWNSAVEQMRQVDARPFKQQFVRDAIEMFYDSTNKVWDWKKMAEPQRDADKEENLWCLFNIVQERLIRGGSSYQLTTKKGRIQDRTTRAIRSADHQLSINQKLFDLAIDYMG